MIKVFSLGHWGFCFGGFFFDTYLIYVYIHAKNGPEYTYIYVSVRKQYFCKIKLDMIDCEL